MRQRKTTGSKPYSEQVIRWDGSKGSGRVDFFYSSPVFLFSSSLGAFSIIFLVWGSLSLCFQGPLCLSCLCLSLYLISISDSILLYSSLSLVSPRLCHHLTFLHLRILCAPKYACFSLSQPVCVPLSVCIPRSPITPECLAGVAFLRLEPGTATQRAE